MSQDPDCSGPPTDMGEAYLDMPAGIWSRIVGHSRTVDFLRHVTAARTPAHAYLFIGPEGVGRSTAAVALAAALNCPDKGCGECPVCRGILGETHPSVRRVSPQGRQISIDQIRDLQHAISLDQRPDVWQVIIIDPAAAMGGAAGNALLKSLEEPPARTVFILLAESLSEVMPTIASRCQSIRFGLLGQSDIAEILSRHGYDSDLLELASKSSTGRAGRAFLLAQSQDLREWRQKFFGLLADLVSGDASARAALIDMVKSSLEDRASIAEESARQDSQKAAEFFGEGRHAAAARSQAQEKMKRAKDRAAADSSGDIHDLIRSWLLDLLSLQAGADPSEMENPDALDSIRKVTWTGTAGMQSLDALQDASEVLGYNVDEMLVFESLFLKLSSSRR